jgi:putative addiction module CopG family antidote
LIAIDFPPAAAYCFGMSQALTGYYKRIIRRQIRTGRFNNENEVVRHSLCLLDAMERAAGPAGSSFGDRPALEAMLLEGLNSGAAVQMSARRRQKIYSALKKA